MHFYIEHTESLCIFKCNKCANDQHRELASFAPTYHVQLRMNTKPTEEIILFNCMVIVLSLKMDFIWQDFFFVIGSMLYFTDGSLRKHDVCSSSLPFLLLSEMRKICFSTIKFAKLTIAEHRLL